MIEAESEITVFYVSEVDRIIRYYLLQAAAADPPGKPTAYPPGGSWTTTEPTYKPGSTDSLYFVDLTVLTNGDCSYSEVSKSSSYDAAKMAYDKAQKAQSAASDAAKTATNYVKYTASDGLVVGNMSDAELKRNVQIVSDAVNIRNGSTILASYSDDEIYLGKNSKKSIIDLCNGSAQMSYVSDSTTGLPYFEIKSGENLRLSAIYTEPGGRKGVTGVSLRSMGREGDTDYADSHWQVSSRIQDGDNSSLAMASGEAGVIWLYTIAKGEAQLKVDGQNSTIEMIGKVTIRDSESGEVGCTITGGVATLADVKTKSGASLKTLDPPKKYTYTTSGITVTVWESPLIVRVKVTGATEAELATKSGYISIGSVKATGMTPAIKKIWVQSNYEVSFRVNASSGKIELGYSIKNGTMVDIPSGTSINIDETFLLV